MKKIIFLFVFFFSFYCINAKDSEDLNISLSLPAYDWCIMSYLPGFELAGLDYSPDGNSKVWKFTNKNDSFLITIFFEKAPENGNSDACRDYYYQRAKMSGKIDEKTVNYFTLRDFSCVKYLYKDKDESNRTQSCNMYLAKEDIWVDVHISKINYKDKDSTLFKNVLNGFVFTPEFKEAILENFIFAGMFYNNKAYETAITFYNETLKAEMKKNRLEKSLRIVLMDNLGMAYAMTGDLVKAKSTFEFGISIYSDCPNFYYNLACTYAETDNLDKAIENLMLTHKYKDNYLEGETAVDPLTDSSFKNYLKDEKFLKAVEEYKK